MQLLYNKENGQKSPFIWVEVDTVHEKGIW